MVKDIFPKFSSEVLISAQTKVSEEEVLNIFLSLDNAFALPTGVAIYSILKNNPSVPLRIHLCGINLGEDSKKKFKELPVPAHSELVLHAFDPKWKVSENRESEHFPLANFIRLALPNLFSQYERIVYLDGDTLCLGSLAPLKKVDLRGKIGAVVPDLPESRKNKSKYLKNTQGYFNAGFLLLNTEECLKAELCEKTFKILTSELTLESPDQDALNMVMEGKTELLDKKFNHIQTLKVGKNQDVEREEDGTVIIHYANRSKPWTHAYETNLYSSYLKDSPWKNAPRDEVYKNDPQSYKKFAVYELKNGKVTKGFKLLGRFIAVLIQRKLRKIKFPGS